MLADSARIQEEDAAVAGVVDHRRGSPRSPLYNRADVAPPLTSRSALPSLTVERRT